MYLVVGLGNPGGEYAKSRHNVGWMVADQLAATLGWIGRADDFDGAAREKFSGVALEGQAGGSKLMILKPTTFMNCSGQSVQAAMAFYQLAAPDVLVVSDDMALPCGKIRIRPGGSSGGHNGLKDIERALGTDAYPRMRLGVDGPPQHIAARDYVLGNFTGQQRELLEPIVESACQAIMTWIERGIEAAMNQYNPSAAGQAPAGA